MAVDAANLKLPAALKAELDRLARESGETTQAIMVRALSEYVAAAKSYRGFLDAARRADAAMQESGLGYAAEDVGAYILAKARGEKARRPRPVKWSK